MEFKLAYFQAAVKHFNLGESPRFPIDCLISFFETLFVLRPTTGQVRHKAFCKVGSDAGPQPTRVRQNPKIPSAPSALPQWGHLRRQETKQQTIGETIWN